MMTKTPLALTAALAACLLAPAVEAKAKTPKLVEAESWYDFSFLGRKVGFMMARDEATQINGRPAVHSHRWSVITVRREKEVVRLEFTTDVYFAPDGTPMRFTQARKEGAERRGLEGYRDGDVMVVRQDVGGSVQESRVPLEGLRLASSLDVIVAQNLKVGWQLSGKVLDEAEGTVQSFEVKVVKKAERGSEPAFEVVQTLGPLTTTMWMRPDGVVLEADTSPIRAKLVRTTKDKAIEMPDGVLDIFSSGMFRVPEGIPAGAQLERVVVRLEGRSGKRPVFMTGAGQKAKRKTKASVDLVLTARNPPNKRTKRPVGGGKSKAFLTATPYEPLEDERLRAVVDRVVGDERDAWAAAKLINRFVHRHIENKSLAKPFATAVEALESKEGDCTEHAVLFSALAKIAGIPTRLVTGLVYVGPVRRVFGYHEWVEVYVGGQWVPMDPTFGQDVADPTHIKFTEGQSDPDGLREAGVVAATLIGDLELSVLEFTTVSGKTKKL